MTDGNTIVRLRNVSKTFGHIRAMDSIDLDIERGRIIGLLGANGAGKSTLLRHIIGLYLADQGQCLTFGTDAARLGPDQFNRIGYVHQEGELLEWMTVRQLIRYVSVYYATWNHDLEARYIEDFDISLGDRVGALSPGQRQKVAILLGIGFEPELLILDEPASALDPIARNRFLDLLLQLIQDENRTIIISSHILSDVEKVIDHVLIMRRGALLRDCGFDALREEYVRFTLTSLNGPLPSPLPFTDVVSCQAGDTRAIVTVRHARPKQLEAQAEAIQCQIEFRPLPLDELYKLVVS